MPQVDPVTTVTVHPPRLEGQVLRVEWSVEPASSLYHRTHFDLEFPPEIDPARVPEGLWWRLALMCLHTQWLVLRPCLVRLQATFPPGEVEFWLRLLEVEAQTLESLRGNMRAERQVEIACEGPEASRPVRLLERGRWASAISGGKDSLVQTALLRDLTPEPLLVTVLSELPGIHDSLNARKLRNMAELAQTPPFRLVNVKSDFRSAWYNNFALERYGVAINELTDTLLYSAATIACAAALGVTHVCIASEADMHENIPVEGVTVQHEVVMYTGSTIGALDALLKPFGLHYSSLVAPLYDAQIAHLLWSKYRDLRHLQLSCWMGDETGTPCGHCGKCTKTGLVAFFSGASPRIAGYDPIAFVEGLLDFSPRRTDQPGPYPRVRERERLRDDLHRVGLIQDTPAWKVGWSIFRSERLRAFTPRTARALFGYHRLRRRLRTEARGPAGLPAAYLAHVDPAIRDRVEAIVRDRFRATDDREIPEASVPRSAALTAWIVEPLALRETARAAP